MEETRLKLLHSYPPHRLRCRCSPPPPPPEKEEEEKEEREEKASTPRDTPPPMQQQQAALLDQIASAELRTVALTGPAGHWRP